MITLSNIQKGAVKAAKPLFALSFLLFTLGSNAQEVQLKSNFISTDKSPVEGAIVSIKGGASSVTDKNGVAEIKAKDANSVVTIKAPGYYECQMPLSYFTKKNARGEQITITLTPLTEKQFTGYVMTPFEKELASLKTATNTGLEMKDFTNHLSVASAIGNNVTGLQMIDKSGMPNEGSYMNIRGIHSLVGENNPLIVINGVPYFGNLNVSDIIKGYSRDFLGGYSAKDIRSITVLKGSDAAQWGSLGSNGVILIETQTANSDNLNTKITFSGQYGMSFAKKMLPMMNASQYTDYARQLGLTLYPSLSSLTGDYPFLQNASGYPTEYLFNENNDWLDQVTRGGFTTDNQIRVEGGDEIAKYNISFGYTKNNGTIKNTNSDRYHTLISADVLVTRDIDIFTNVSLSYIKSNLQNVGTYSDHNVLTSSMWNYPMISAYKKQAKDGSTLPNLATYNEWNTSSNPMFPYNNVSNPISIIENVKGTDKIYDANAGLGINFRINDYLKLQGLVNLYYNYTEENMFVPGVTEPTIIPGYYGKGDNYTASGVVRQMTNNYQVRADYKRTWNNVHDFKGLVTARFMTHKLEIDGMDGYNTPNDYITALQYLQDGQKTFGSNSEWNYMSYGVHADYLWNKIVRVNAGLNVDGTSASGSDTPRMGFFPNVGVTLYTANTADLPKWISKLDLTYELSMTGNARFSSNYSKDYFVGTTGIGGISRENMPNTQLKWEKTMQMDFGVEAGFLNNRIMLGVNLFAARNYDLLVKSNVSSTYGSSVFYDNKGEIYSSGLEYSLRVNPIHTKDWDLTVGANMSIVKNTLKSVGGAEQNVISFTEFNNDDAQVLMKVGDRPYQFYGYQTSGVYATTAQAQQSGLVNAAGQAYQAGDMIFVDQNGDGIINDKDKVALGSAQAKAFGAINLALRYKQFTLGTNFSYSLGNKAYNYTRRQAESMTKFYNQSTAVMNSWKIEGQQTEIPRAVYGDAIGNSAFSDRWIEDASYLKLRSLKLSYDFGKLFGFINSGNVWVAAENLLTATKYLGADPEFSYGYTECMRGFDYAKLANPRTVKIGFDLNF